MRRLTGACWVLSVLLVVPGCGGDATDGGPSPAENEVKTLRRGGEKPETQNDDAGSGEGSEEPVSREEARRRVLLAKLKKQLEAARDSDERAEAISNVTQFGPAARGLLHLVVKALDDEESMTRVEALGAVVAIDPAGCRSFLEAGLRDPDAQVRLRAVKGWGEAEIADLLPLIEHARNEIEEKVQGAVMLVIEARAPEVLAPQVARILGDLDAVSVVTALRFLEAKRAVAQLDAIIELLHRDDTRVRIKAAATIQAFGVKTPRVLLAIVQALEDDDEDVRKAASKAIRKLTGQDLGYRSWDGPADREKAVKAYRDWVKANEKSLGS